MFKKFIPFIPIFIVVIILYYPVLSTYFSHDDFFHFKVSQTDGGLKEFFKFFTFQPFEERRIAFFRPVFREVLYNSFYLLFGLNALPFRLLSFIIHFINIYLVFTLIEKVFKKKLISYFSTFFFAITSANVASFYYLAGGIQTQGVTTFILLTLIAFFNYLKTDKEKYKLASFLAFALALASHEQAALIPFLLAGLVLIENKNLTRLRELWPYFLVLSIYIYLNITIIGYSSQETQYKMTFNLKSTLNTLSWYSVWAMGIPEMLVDFLNPGFKLNPSLMKYWGNFFRVIFTAFAVSGFLAILNGLATLFKKRKTVLNKQFLFFTIWFPLGLLPVLFLPGHKSSHYLYPVLPAFWGTFGYVIFQGFNFFKKYNLKIAQLELAIFTISLFVLSATSAKLEETTYWAAARGRLAEKIINEVKNKYPELPKGSTIYFTNDPNYPFVSKDWGGTSKQAYYALNNQDALQLVYNDPSLKVYYKDEGESEYYPQDLIHTITAPIP